MIYEVVLIECPQKDNSTLWRRKAKEVIYTNLTKEKDMILDYKESKTPIHPEIKVIPNTDYKKSIDI